MLLTELAALDEQKAKLAEARGRLILDEAKTRIAATPIDGARGTATSRLLSGDIVEAVAEMMSYTAQVGAEEANAGIKPMGMGSGHDALDALQPQSHQGICGDAIASMEGISREALDALALVSQQRADMAIK